jgi:hypothetical protein
MELIEQALPNGIHDLTSRQSVSYQWGRFTPQSPSWCRCITCKAVRGSQTCTPCSSTVTTMGSFPLQPPPSLLLRLPNFRQRSVLQLDLARNAHHRLTLRHLSSRPLRFKLGILDVLFLVHLVHLGRMVLMCITLPRLCYYRIGRFWACRLCPADLLRIVRGWNGSCSIMDC